MAHNRLQNRKKRTKRNNADIIKKDSIDGWPSGKQDQAQSSAAISTKKLHGFRSEEKNFDLLVDRVPYVIRSIPVLFNDELRFRIIINGYTEHLFTWDSQIGMLRAIDDDASVLPDGLELALNEKLQSQLK